MSGNAGGGKTEKRAGLPVVIPDIGRLEPAGRRVAT
jgi:hypothetical protein